MSFTKRALGALAAGAITLPFLASPALAAPGDTPIPTPRDITSFCVNPGALTFTDVVASGDALANELALAIRCLNTAITRTDVNPAPVIAQGNPGTPSQPQGIGADKYGPQLEVTRGQMASFIARMIDAASVRELREANIRELPAPGAANPFPGDLPNNYVHLDNIKRLTQAGIVTGNPGTAQQPNGIGANRYGPDLPVTRSQMASFINRAVAYATGGNAANAGTAGNGFAAPNAEYYTDAQQAIHVRNVNGITAGRIANGIGNKQYNGLGTVSRQQMARFIARTLSALNTPADAGQPSGQRIGTLREVFSANFSDADRDTATRLAAPSGNAPATSERTFTATGLASGVEYRITLVKAGQITRATTTNNEVRFATGTASGANFLVNTGTPLADIVSVNGGAPVNNTAAGANTTPNDLNDSRSVVATAVNGTITFTIEGEGAEDVVAVIYFNGGGTQTSYQSGGGAAAPLEVDAQGRPIEFFGVTGVTQFVV